MSAEVRLMRAQSTTRPLEHCGQVLANGTRISLQARRDKKIANGIPGSGPPEPMKTISTSREGSRELQRELQRARENCQRTSNKLIQNWKTDSQIGERRSSRLFRAIWDYLERSGEIARNDLKSTIWKYDVNVRYLKVLSDDESTLCESKMWKYTMRKYTIWKYTMWKYSQPVALQKGKRRLKNRAALSDELQLTGELNWSDVVLAPNGYAHWLPVPRTVCG